MAIDFMSNNNLEIRDVIDAHNLDEAKFWVGDKIRFKKNAIDLLVNTEHYSLSRDEFINDNMGNTLKIICKFKYDIDDPWWSEIKGEKDIKEYVYDDWLLLAEPSYKPRKIIREFKKFINR